MSLGLSRSDYWEMSPHEVGLWLNANRPRQMICGMTEEQAQRVTDLHESDLFKKIEAENAAKFSQKAGN